MPICIDAERVSVSRPDRPLFTDLSVTVASGDRLGVVGINGTGKSTLLRVLAGDLAPDSGVVRRGRGVRVGFLAQRADLPPGTVRAAAGGGWEAEAALDRLGMGDLLDTPTTQLSGGQAKRVALAALLCRDHDVLILDEPTNHLDLDAIAYLEQRLGAHSGGLVLVTHDRHVLDRVTTRVLELDRGTGYLHVPSGPNAGSGYAAYLDGRATREEQAAAAEQTRQILARRELAWLRRGAPARSRKPKARIAAATAIVDGRAQAPARHGNLQLSVGSTRLGSKAIEVHGAGFTWPDGREVLAPTDWLIEPGDRIGIVGPNGAGKTTLLDLIAGRRTPTTGRIERGRTVEVGYYDQLGRELDPEQRVRDAVAGPHQAAPSVADVTLMQRFWFDGDAQWARIGTLSGGERRRLQLLLTLVAQPNVLLLDEPTNDLDLDTLRALEEFCDGWPGALIVVSHDRAFLDRTVDEIVAVGGGKLREVRGGVAGWLAERAATVTAAADKPRAVPARPAPTASVAVPKAGRSPSTLRRLIGQAERVVEDATATRDGLLAELTGAGSDHVRLSEIGARLSAAEVAVASAEESWMTLAEEAAAAGLEV